MNRGNFELNSCTRHLRLPLAAVIILLFCVRASAGPLTAPVYFVCVDNHDYRFVIELRDTEKIELARRYLAQPSSTPWIAGTLLSGDGGYNRDVGRGQTWGWHLDADSISFPEVTAEGIQTSVAGIQENLDYWLRLGRCAIGARIECEGIFYRPGQFVNQSARSWVGTGDDVQIAGFVVQGTEQKAILIRAAGPALSVLGVTNVLADPMLEIHDQKTGLVIASNDNWSDDSDIADRLEATAARVGAVPWLRQSKDAALLLKLAPGVYTAVVRGKENGTGNALVELYNADEPSGTRLVNISERAKTKGGDDVQIGGFVIGGAQQKKVLIRAAGPALAAQGVSGVLTDPALEIYDQRSGKRIYANLNWGDSDAGAIDQMEAAVKSVGAAPWNRGSKDAALLVMLEPGIYTAVVGSENGSSGVSLVEVFEVPE